jgi:flagellar motor switch protein FliN/FliY
MLDDEDSPQEEDDLWAAAAEDLEVQREMLHKQAESVSAEVRKKAEPPPELEEEPVRERVSPFGAPSALATRPEETRVEAPRAGESPIVSVIMDIPLAVTVRLGSTKMLINDLLQLGQGSVIELTKLVGEPLDVMVNQKLIARGEVVVVNEKFGVRLTEVVSPTQRIESLG